MSYEEIGEPWCGRSAPCGPEFSGPARRSTSVSIHRFDERRAAQATQLMYEAFASRGTTCLRAREIKAFIHRSRVADVVNTLRTAGFRNVSLLDVCELVEAFKTKEREYSLGARSAVSLTVKLEVICDNESQTAEAIALIRIHAKTNEPYAGRIYVSELLSGMDIGD